MIYMGVKNPTKIYIDGLSIYEYKSIGVPTTDNFYI